MFQPLMIHEILLPCREILCYRIAIISQIFPTETANA